MIQFKYKARKLDSTLIEGVLVGDSPSQISQKLVQQGLFPISVYPVGEERDFFSTVWSFLTKIRHSNTLNSNKLAWLARTLSDLLEAGLTLPNALKEMTTQTRDKSLKIVITNASDGVSNGLPLFKALEGTTPKVPLSFLGTIESGESSGNLPKILAGLALINEEDAALSKSLKRALVYPTMVATVALGTMVVLFSFLLPRLTTLYSGLSQDLPQSTKLLLQFSDFSQQYGIWVFLVISLVLLVIKISVRNSENLQFEIERLRLAIPIFGPLISLREIVLFCQSLSGLITGGVPLTTSLVISARTANVGLFSTHILNAEKQLSEGLTLSEATSKSVLDFGSLNSLIKIGEENGDLARAMSKAASMFRAEFNERTKLLTTVLGPVLIVGLGIVVAFIVFAMMVPILEIEV